VTAPLLALALGRHAPGSLVPLLVAARRWCLPVALDPVAGRPSAVLAIPSCAQRVAQGVPVALWTRSIGEATSPMGVRAAAIVSDEQAIVEAAGVRGVLAPPGSPARDRHPVPPFVRERVRRARGLPDVATLEQADRGWLWTGRAEPLEEDLVPTAMACASAVVAGVPEAALEALAWGAPCVLDPATADAIGATSGTHALVGADGAERTRLAACLATDAERAARLSRAGRRLVETRHDAGWHAVRLVELLELLPPPPERALASARLQLDVLGTPADARIRTRLRVASKRFDDPPHDEVW
jgi:hypothetical protein